VLTGAGLGDDALFVHAASQQDLPDRVVYFMRAGMEEIFAFEIDRCATAVVCQSCGVKEWRGPARVVVLKRVKLCLERLIITTREIRRS
jgi:hypothetical protein